MRSAVLTRQPSTPEGTFGRWRSDSGFECMTLERPENIDHPCVPKGTYNVKWTSHPIHGYCYELCAVPGRTAILIHGANVFQQLQGCIAPGADEVIFPAGSRLSKTLVLDKAQNGIASSKPTLFQLEKDMTDCGRPVDFTLTIQ